MQLQAHNVKPCVAMGMRFVVGYITCFLIQSIMSQSNRLCDMQRKLLLLTPVILVIVSLIVPWRPQLKRGVAHQLVTSVPRLHEEVQLFIKLPSGNSLTYLGKRGNTISDVMDFISARTFLTFTPESPFRLSAANGDVFVNGYATLHQCGFRNAQQLYILGRLLGGGPKRPPSKPSGELGACTPE